MSDERKDGRKRFQHACDSCRHRKVRCNSETMPDNVCSSCLNLNIKCVHTKLQQKRGPKPGSTRTAASHSVHVLVAAILHGTQSDPFDVPDDKETVLKILVKLASRIKSLERELATSHRRLHNASSNSSPATVSSSQPSPEANADESSDDGDEIDNLSTAVARFSLSFPKQTHFGESSNLMIVMAAMDYQKEVTSNFTLWQSILSNVRRPTFWENPSWAVRPAQTFPTFEFPDQATLHKLIDSHFTELNLYFPLLHRPTFQRSLAGGLHLRDPAFGALVLMVCACGSVFAYPQHPRGDTKTSGWQWFNQVPFEKLVFSENLSLYHLQAYCLAIYYLEQVEITLRPDMSWLLSGIAIRLAQGRGAHRRSDQKSRPTVEGELWKRVFWHLIQIDVGMAEFYGRPRATPSQNFDLDPIIECDDEYWECEDGDMILKQPNDKPSLLSFWGCFLKLELIHGIVQETIYSIRKPGLNASAVGLEWYQQAVIELDSALNNWVDTVPPHLQWDKPNQNDIFFSQSAILWSTYYFVQIQVHRRFIPRPSHTSDFPFPSLTICTNAARSCIRVIEAHCRRRHLGFGFHLMISLFNSALILTINLWRGITTKSTNLDPRKETAEIYKCIDLLRLYESRYVLAGRFIDMINTVMSASHCAPRLSGGTGLATCDQTSAGLNLLSPLSIGIQEDSPAMPPTESFNSQQHFEIPLYTSDLGGTHWFDSPPFDNHASPPSENLKTVQEVNLLNPSFINQYGTQPGTFSRSSYPASDGSNIPLQPNSGMPVWPTNPSEQDWNSFMASVDQLFNIPHDPIVDNQSGIFQPFSAL